MSLTSYRGARALRHRNYRFFFVGQLISLIGTWMQQVAQGWLVLQLTGNPLFLGLIAVAQFGPVLIFGLFGGLLADHLPKRKTLLVTQAVAMALALVLFVLTATGVVEVWHVAVLAALLGITNAIDMPTRQAFAVEMVGREDVANAVGLNSALFNGSRIVGPAIAGLLIAFTDISVAFLVNGITYIAVLLGYWLMRESELRSPPPIERPTSARDVFDNLAEGVGYVRNTPIVLLACTVVGLVATVGMNFQVLVPPLADHVLRVGAEGFGFLMAASGIGSTVSSLTVAFSRRPRAWWIPGGAIALGVGSLVLGWSTSFPLSLAAMALAGAGGLMMAVTANTMIQLSVPDSLRGRVMSVYTTVFAGSVPAGGLLMGWVASVWGVATGFLLGGLLSVAVGVPALLWVRRIKGAGRFERREPAGADATPVPTGAGAESPLGRGAPTGIGSATLVSVQDGRRLEEASSDLRARRMAALDRLEDVATRIEHERAAGGPDAARAVRRDRERDVASRE
jgi:MFS family permease